MLSVSFDLENAQQFESGIQNVRCTKASDSVPLESQVAILRNKYPLRLCIQTRLSSPQIRVSTLHTVKYNQLMHVRWVLPQEKVLVNLRRPTRGENPLHEDSPPKPGGDLPQGGRDERLGAGNPCPASDTVSIRILNRFTAR